MKRKNIYLILLCCLLCLGFSVLYSFSESNGGGSNDADGGGWNTEMSGYRFTIVDRNFNAVKII